MTTNLPLLTPRLLIRKIEDDDLPFLVALLGDAETMRFWPRPYTADEARAWIARHRERYASHGYGYWTAVDAASGEPVGQVGVLHQWFGAPDAERDEVGLGWIIARTRWREGLAAEAGAACLAWALANTRFDRVVALIRPENEPSAGVARKLGLTRGERVEYSGFAHDVWFRRRDPLR
jgi:RimJ/RimL family protein N-acetyltransferase